MVRAIVLLVLLFASATVMANAREPQYYHKRQQQLIQQQHCTHPVSSLRGTIEVLAGSPRASDIGTVDELVSIILTSSSPSTPRGTSIDGTNEIRNEPQTESNSRMNSVNRWHLVSFVENASEAVRSRSSDGTRRNPFEFFTDVQHGNIFIDEVVERSDDVGAKNLELPAGTAAANVVDLSSHHGATVVVESGCAVIDEKDSTDMLGVERRLVWGPRHAVLLVSSMTVLSSPNDLQFREPRAGNALAGKNVGNMKDKVPTVEIGSSLYQHRAAKAVDLRRMVVFITYFEGAEVVCNSTSINDVLWKNQFSVRGMFEDNSFGTVEFGGDIAGNEKWDIFGPYKIDFEVDTGKQTKEDCDAGLWADKVDHLARLSGISLDKYQHRVYVIPRKADDICKWEGLGWLSCSLYCRAWVNTCDRMETFVHELGHNLGFRHSATNWDETGDVIEYGDPTAFMGNSFFSSDAQLIFNAPHKVQKGWIAPPSPIRSTGFYKIAPINQLPDNSEPPGLSQALKVANPAQRQGFYYISYMTTRSNYSHQLLLHRVDKPGDLSQLVAVLDKPGLSYQDPLNTFSVTFWSLTTQSMKVWIAFGCRLSRTYVDFFKFVPIGVRSALNVLEPFSLPTATSSTSINLLFNLSAGESLNRLTTVRLANQDSPLCTPSTYTFSASFRRSGTNATYVPLSAGSPFLIDAPDFQVIPAGEACFVDITISAGATANVLTEGYYDITLNINGTTSDGREIAEHSDALLIMVEVVGTYPTPNPADCIFAMWTDQTFDGEAVVVAGGAGTEFEAFLLWHSRCFSSVLDLTLDVSVTITPQSWGGQIASSQVTIARGELANVFVSVLAPLDAEKAGSVAQLKLWANSSFGSTTLRANITAVASSGCNTPLNVTLATSSFSLETRSSHATSVLVTNFDERHCPPRLFLNLPAQSRAAAVPDIQLSQPSRTMTSVAMYTSVLQTKATAENVTLPFTFLDPVDFSTLASVTLTAMVDRTECVRAPPEVIFLCPSKVNNRTSATNPQVTINCFARILNHDTWPCPTTIFGTSWELHPPGMTVESKYPHDHELFAGNYTGYMEVSIKLPLTPPTEVLNGSAAYLLNITFKVTDLTSSDANTVALHTRAIHPGRTPLLKVGECYCDPPLLWWDKSSTPTIQKIVNRTNEFGNGTVEEFVECAVTTQHLGGVSGVSLNIRQNCSEFCEFGLTYKTDSPATSSFRLGAITNSVDYSSGLSFSWYPSPFSLGTGQSRRLSLYFYSSPAIIPPTAEVFANATEITFNVTIMIADTRNSSSASTLTALVTVRNDCVPSRPVITFPAGSPAPITTGRSRMLTLPISVRNTDDPLLVVNCSNYYGGTYLPHFRLSIQSGFAPSMVLAPNETKTVNATVYTGDNINPGVYSRRVSVADSIVPTGWHSTSNSFDVTVKCPVPRAVSLLTAVAIKPFFGFGLQAGPVFLSWKACAHSLWCCCPCSWTVERDGQVIGNTTTLNFTDTSKIDVGKQYVYTVTTVDKHGVPSSNSSCDNFVTLQVRPPNLSGFFVWLAAASCSILCVGLIARYSAFLALAWPQLQKGEPVRFFAPTAFFFLMSLKAHYGAIAARNLAMVLSGSRWLGRQLRALWVWLAPRVSPAARWVASRAKEGWVFVRSHAKDGWVFVKDRLPFCR